jgi:outer membrane protein
VKQLSVVLSLFIAVSGIAAAQAAAPTKVGVIHFESALVQTQEGRAAAAVLDTKLAPKRKELEAQQGEIKELQEKLSRGGNTMSQAAKDDVQRNIDQKTKNFNRDVEDFQADSEQEQRKVIDELSQKLQPVILKYAQDNGFAVILDVSSPNTPVLWRADSVDITLAIIDQYDKTHPASAPAKPAAAKPAGGAPASTPAAKPPATIPPPAASPAKPPAATPAKPPASTPPPAAPAKP